MGKIDGRESFGDEKEGCSIVENTSLHNLYLTSCLMYWLLLVYREIVNCKKIEGLTLLQASVDHSDVF